MITPHQARELVHHFGSQQKAADAVGVSRALVRAWLDPDKAKARAAQWYAKNREAAREVQRAYNRANKPHLKRYRRRIARGVCGKCGRADLETRTTCYACNAAAKERGWLAR